MPRGVPTPPEDLNDCAAVWQYIRECDGTMFEVVSDLYACFAICLSCSREMKIQVKRYLVSGGIVAPGMLCRPCSSSGTPCLMAFGRQILPCERLSTHQILDKPFYLK